MSDKPLLLIDVDGPLNPYANSNNQLRKGKVFHLYKLLGFKVWLTRWHGEELMKLAELYELVWCTTWEHDANSLIGPRIGLPDLPVIEFEKLLPSQPPVAGLHWKVAGIRLYADGRPFAWIDDEASQRDDQYLRDTHNAPCLVRQISPVTGLTKDDFAALREWAENDMPEWADGGERVGEI